MSLDTSTSLLDRLSDRNSDQDWKLFVEIYHPFIESQLRRCGIAAADTDDLAQEALATVFTALPKFSHNGRRGAFRKWLKSIVIQRVGRLFRTQQRKPVQVGSPTVNRTIDATWEAELARTWNAEHDQYVLQRLMEVIRPEFRQSTWLAFEKQVLENRAAREVADQLGTSINAVLVSKSRVLRRLRNLGDRMIDQ